MDDIIDMLEGIREQKHWSYEVFLEKIASFAQERDLEDELTDFLLALEIESICEDEYQDTVEDI
jgi:hypothetical protein